MLTEAITSLVDLADRSIFNICVSEEACGVEIEAALADILEPIELLLSNAFVNVFPYRNGEPAPKPLRYKGNAQYNTAKNASAVLVCVELFFERARSAEGLVGNISMAILDAGPNIPRDTALTLYEANLNTRLPSRKPGGGRGILTAISLIQERFRGTCKYDEGGWFISIPGSIRDEDHEVSSASKSSTFEAKKPGG